MNNREIKKETNKNIAIDTIRANRVRNLILGNIIVWVLVVFLIFIVLPFEFKWNALAVGNNENEVVELIGNGTSTSPFEITNQLQLQYISETTNYERYWGSSSQNIYYTLLNDIEITSTYWSPIGNANNIFYGIFDGNGHSITFTSPINLKNVSDESYYAGVFGRVAGTIKNLSIEWNALNVSNELAEATIYVGGIAGNATTILNCYTLGNISVDNSYGEVYAGGILGASGNILNSYNESNITISNGTNVYLGGISGRNGNIYNCYNLGNLTITNSTLQSIVGGITGYRGNIINCFNIGVCLAQSQGTYSSCGIVGSEGSVSNSYYLTSTAEMDGGGVAIDNLDTLMKDSNNFGASIGIDDYVWADAQPWLMDSTWTMNNGDYPKLRIFNLTTEEQNRIYSGGLTKDTAIVLSTQADLENLAWASRLAINYQDRYFELSNIINITSSNWQAIGYNSYYTFAGNFDGNQYSIIFPNITSTSAYYGLFGYVTNEISNIVVNYESLTVSGTNVFYVGGIVGYNAGRVLNCSVSGTMTFESDISIYSGGAVGYNAGYVANISADCEMTVTDTAGTINVGIVVGGYNANAIITSCTSSGNLEVLGASNILNVGGIVGYGNGDLYASTNNANLTSTAGTNTRLGGVVGTATGGFIENCVNSGVVTGDSGYNLNVGGIVGLATSISSFVECENNGNIISGIISVDNVNVNTIVQGGLIGSLSNNNIILKDLTNFGNVQSGKLNANATSTIRIIYAGGLVGRGGQFVNCVNNAQVQVSEATGGIYIGGISGYDTLNASDCINRGEISGTSNNSAVYVGGIIGMSSADITNCQNYGNINANSLSGATYSGGITAHNQSSIMNSYNIGAVSAINESSTLYAAGIAGVAIIVNNCYNAGEITAQTNSGNSTAAGIVGIMNRTGSVLTYSTNYGIVNSITSVNVRTAVSGGIIGANTSANVEYCYNIGQIYGLYAGGICGTNQSTISNCYNTGAIIGGTKLDYEQNITANYVYVGGIVGNNGYANALVQFCYNLADIKAISMSASVPSYSISYSVVGGIAGNSRTGIINCFNLGDVVSQGATNTNRVGGISGVVVTLTACYYDSSLTGTDSNTGILVDNLDSLMTSESNYIGQIGTTGYEWSEAWDFVNTWSIDSEYNDVYPHLQRTPFIIINYQYSSGNTNSNIAQIINYDEEINYLPQDTFENDDYYFTAWTDGTNFYDCDSIVNIKAPVTLYPAEWYEFTHLTIYTNSNTSTILYLYDDSGLLYQFTITSTQNQIVLNLKHDITYTIMSSIWNSITCKWNGQQVINGNKVEVTLNADSTINLTINKASTNGMIIV